MAQHITAGNNAHRLVVLVNNVDVVNAVLEHPLHDGPHAVIGEAGDDAVGGSVNTTRCSAFSHENAARNGQVQVPGRRPTTTKKRPVDRWGDVVTGQHTEHTPNGVHY